MFTRALTERVTQQRKTMVNGPMGQVETWTDVRTFWASVVGVSADAQGGWAGSRKQEGTLTIYDIMTRNLKRDWQFKDTRFVWNATDADNTRILKPMRNILTPKQTNHDQWATIRCQDITPLKSPC